MNRNIGSTPAVGHGYVCLHTESSRGGYTHRKCNSGFGSTVMSGSGWGNANRRPAVWNGNAVQKLSVRGYWDHS